MLIIDSIQSSHSGNYSCKISNRFGYDTFTTELLVEGPPNWIEQPKDIKSHHGETIIVNCKVSGHPKPRIQWRRLSGSSWINFVSEGTRIKNIELENDKLIITNVSRSDNGRFGCSAINGIEPNLWSEFEISIEGSPNWISKPVDVKSTLGDSLTIQCSASGYPKPIIQWKKFQGSWINLSSNGTTNENVQQSSEKLILSNASRDTGGRYGCSVANGIRPDL
ncbi:peroxidasin homolog [Panonychus citri]|uniref:peroxidasin homolog n=1 Tax=Panonychus citri TaxID=50023 RepID=UPI002307D026|nr:peroxidasin homolog [Panonychus citri]